MSNSELVKGMADIARSLSGPDRVVMLNAITALTAQDDARDRALEEAAMAAYNALCAPPPKYYLRAEARVISQPIPNIARETILALKSKPATSTAECKHEWGCYGQGMRCAKCGIKDPPVFPGEPADDTEAQRQSWVRGEMAMGESVSGTKPWTRADGSTSPVRTGEVDRRKSADGDEDCEFMRRLDVKTMYGRRADDRARWTQPPAPEVKQGLVDARASLTDEEVRTAIAIRNLRDAFFASGGIDTRLGGKNV